MNVFWHDSTKNGSLEVYPLKISENTGAQPVDLTFVADAETQHFCWVNSLSRLLTVQLTDHKEEAYFCHR